MKAHAELLQTEIPTETTTQIPLLLADMEVATVLLAAEELLPQDLEETVNY